MVLNQGCCLKQWQELCKNCGEYAYSLCPLGFFFFFFFLFFFFFFESIIVNTNLKFRQPAGGLKCDDLD